MQRKKKASVPALVKKERKLKANFVLKSVFNSKKLFF
jgi:hypothetical protein